MEGARIKYLFTLFLLLGRIRTLSVKEQENPRSALDKHMKKYELMYILMPTLSDEELEKENEKLQKLLTDNGAQITGVNKWGRRDLAYEIKKQTKGYYVVVELNAEGAIVDQATKVRLLDEKVMRFLFTVAH